MKITAQKQKASCFKVGRFFCVTELQGIKKRNHSASEKRKTAQRNTVPTEVTGRFSVTVCAAPGRRAGARRQQGCCKTHPGHRGCRTGVGVSGHRPVWPRGAPCCCRGPSARERVAGARGRSFASCRTRRGRLPGERLQRQTGTGESRLPATAREIRIPELRSFPEPRPGRQRPRAAGVSCSPGRGLGGCTRVHVIPGPAEPGEGSTGPAALLPLCLMRLRAGPAAPSWGSRWSRAVPVPQPGVSPSSGAGRDPARSV